jgi:hypothetical protein
LGSKRTQKNLNTNDYCDLLRSFDGDRLTTLDE